MSINIPIYNEIFDTALEEVEEKKLKREFEQNIFNLHDKKQQQMIEVYNKVDENTKILVLNEISNASERIENKLMKKMTTMMIEFEQEQQLNFLHDEEATVTLEIEKGDKK